MSKRWTLKDDEFLVAHSGAIAGDDWLNYLASHDLGYHGKDAGKKRMAKLRETGVLSKIEASQKADGEMHDAWGLAFGSPSWKELILERSFDPEILAAHAEFGGDLQDMQRQYDESRS